MGISDVASADRPERERTATGASSPAVRDERRTVAQVLAPELLDRLGWDRHTAPPAIRLIAAALRDSVPLEKVVPSILANDPEGAAPIIAMLAEQDPGQTAMTIFEAAEHDHFRVSSLMADLAVSNPVRAEEILRLLADEYRVTPVALVGAAVRAGLRGFARGQLAGTLDASDRAVQRLAADLVNLVIDDPGQARNAVNLLHDTLVTPNSRGAAVRLLHWIARADTEVATDLFIALVHRDVRARDSFLGVQMPLLGILAGHYPQGVPTLLLAHGADGLPWHHSYHREVGNLLVDVAMASPERAAQIIIAMANQKPRRTMAVLSAADDSEIVAETLVAVAERHVAPAAEILRYWMSGVGNDVTMPAGTVVWFMLKCDPLLTTEVVAAAVTESLPGGQRTSTLQLRGLQETEMRTIASVLRSHAEPEQWRQISRAMAVAPYRLVRPRSL